MYGCVKGVRIAISSFFRWLNDHYHRNESERVLRAFSGSDNLTFLEYTSLPCAQCGHMVTYHSCQEGICQCGCAGWRPGKRLGDIVG